MKATLSFEYDTDNPADVQFINRILKADEMANVLFELRHNIYGRTDGKTRVEVCEWVNELIRDHGLSNTEEYIS